MISLLLTFIFVVWVKRVLWISRFRKTHPPISLDKHPIGPFPKLSIIVPAKNEEKNIANCLYHLQRQTYAPYEIIVVDDRSSDRTPHLLENFNKISPVPMRVVRIEKLPEGWTGKNHAMSAGAQAASGEWLLFTDADTTHQAGSAAAALACALEKKIDFLTLSPETESRSFWEKTVQPLAVSSLALWFNPDKVNDATSGVTLANGQFILIRKEAYEKIGGNASVKMEVVEDVALAKKARQAGFNVQFLNGTLLYSTRMYSSLAEIKTGWARILTYLFEKRVGSVLHKMFLFAFFSLFPFLVLSIEIGFKFLNPGSLDALTLAISAALCIFIVLVRAVGNKLVKSNPFFAVLHPLGSVIMLWILGVCLFRILFNRPSVWRGEHYR